MACEDIEQRLRNLRTQKQEIEAVIGNLQGPGLLAATGNLARITAEIAVEEKNLAECKAISGTGGTVEGTFIGYVGAIESETRGVSRLWFGLTSEGSGTNWLKETNKRVWLTMNLESADRPSHMAQLTLLLEAMRSRLHVKVTHDGVAPNFFKEVAGDSYEVNGVRVLRSGLEF
jgi:hypothetical protein